MIIARKLKITVIGSDEERKEKYRWIRDEQYNQYRGLNMGMTYLATGEILRMNESGLEIRLEKQKTELESKVEKAKLNIEKIKIKIEKIKTSKKINEEKILENQNKIDDEKANIIKYKNNIIKIEQALKVAKIKRMDIQMEFKEKYIDDLYQVLDKVPFQHLDNKSLITQRVKNDIKADKTSGLLKGERSIRNYKRTFPLLTRGRDLKFYYDDKDIKIKWIEGIEFKVVLGNRIKNSLELRHTLNKVVNEEYKICDSSLQFDKNNNLILNLTLDIPENNKNEKVEGRVVGVDLGMKIPAYVVLNDVEYIKKSIGSIDDFLKVRTQMQSRRRKFQKQLQSANGGRGRNKKLQSLSRFEEKEKKFAKTYNHFISSNIIKFAVDNKASQINLEFLSLKETQEKSVLRNWSYYQLQQFIEYKAKREGIGIKYVDPYHTSQTCSVCGNYEEGQREIQEKFICKNPKCKCELNADYNAARNIAKSTKYIKSKEESEFYKLNKKE
ncbi:transposase [Clostridium senegalense]|uniref:RNA-guided endonuclease TnpB family protein n=1 Tax=Clostridium senegalense TaxID=1465809 RepID=UPI001C10D535|nr:RNA-guided endonuclease TnpB family protein [Clostridium senegalense]MBU5227874.1 transposase [Clostridium senegalense]